MLISSLQASLYLDFQFSPIHEDSFKPDATTNESADLQISVLASILSQTKLRTVTVALPTIWVEGILSVRLMVPILRIQVVFTSSKDNLEYGSSRSQI